MTMVGRSSGSMVVTGVSTALGRATVAPGVWLVWTEVGEVGSPVDPPVLPPLGVVPSVGVPLVVGKVVGTSVTGGPPGRVTG